MTVWLLFVLTYESGRVEHVQFYTEKSCLVAAEKLRKGIGRTTGFVECVKRDKPDA